MLDQEYKTILVGIDGSDQSFLAYDKALAVAQRNNSQVIAVHVIENKLNTTMGYVSLTDDVLNQENENAKDLMKDCEVRAKRMGFSQLQTVITYGVAKEIICKELPKKYAVDLIMVGQSGLNAMERWIIGSVSSYTIRHASCDVLLVHPELGTDE